MFSFVIDTPLFVQTCNVEIYVQSLFMKFYRSMKFGNDEVYRFCLASELINGYFIEIKNVSDRKSGNNCTFDLNTRTTTPVKLTGFKILF